MRLLLDTHVLLWALGDPTRLKREVRDRIDASEALVSAASIWEIAIKSSLGKLDARPSLVLKALRTAGFVTLPVTPEHAARVAELEPHHHDPFDRVLIAQARMEGLTLLTNDRVLVSYGESVDLI